MKDPDEDRKSVVKALRGNSGIREMTYGSIKQEPLEKTQRKGEEYTDG